MKSVLHLNTFMRARADEQMYIEECRTADLDLERIKYFKREKERKQEHEKI